MNEELKIIITAVTASAKKGINDVSKSVKGLDKDTQKTGKGFKGAMGKIGSAAVVAAGIAVAAIAAITAALKKLGTSTKEYRNEQAKLVSAFQAMGSTSQQASKTFNNLFRFMGDNRTAVETANHLAKLTTNERELAEWTTALQGVYATFGDSLPIEGLAEAANETAKVGKVTGNLADALNWAGVSEDAFNASLATANSESERQTMIRQTLNGLYSEAAALYEKNNAAIIAENEATARLNETLGRLGKTVQPLLTALTNLSNTLLTALEPAIRVVSTALTWLINALNKAINAIVSFFRLLSGKGGTTADSIEDAATNIGGATTGATGLGSALGSAAANAQKLKRATAGFDELNVMSNPNSASSGNGATGGGVGSLPTGGSIIDTSGIDSAIDTTSAKMEKFFEWYIKQWKKLQKDLEPTTNAIRDMLSSIGENFKENALPHFQSGWESIKGGFIDLYKYLTDDFMPNITNTFSTNILPIFTDIFNWGTENASKDFEMLGGVINSVCNDIIIPALEGFKGAWKDVCETLSREWGEHGETLMERLGKVWSSTRQTISRLYYDVILPIWLKIKEVFRQVWDEGLKPLIDEIVDACMVIGEEITLLYNEYIAPVVDWIERNIWPVIVKIIGWIVEKVGEGITSISGVIRGIVQVIKGVIQLISGVLTGDWDKAWTGFKNIFLGIWEAIKSAVKVPINAIIGFINVVLGALEKCINACVRGINKIKVDIPDWVPVYGGRTFGFSLGEISIGKIPKLATGGIVTSETLARIGEGGKKEAVLPLEQNTQWMDMLADRIASRNSAPTKIVLTLDGNELGWANIHSINNITKQTGSLQLSLA